MICSNVSPYGTEDTTLLPGLYSHSGRQAATSTQDDSHGNSFEIIVADLANVMWERHGSFLIAGAGSEARLHP